MDVDKSQRTTEEDIISHRFLQEFLFDPSCGSMRPALRLLLVLVYYFIMSTAPDSPGDQQPANEEN